MNLLVKIVSFATKSKKKKRCDVECDTKKFISTVKITKKKDLSNFGHVVAKFILIFLPHKIMLFDPKNHE